MKKKVSLGKWTALESLACDVKLLYMLRTDEFDKWKLLRGGFRWKLFGELKWSETVNHVGAESLEIARQDILGINLIQLNLPPYHCDPILIA